jgi:hypothetical protein
MPTPTSRQQSKRRRSGSVDNEKNNRKLAFRVAQIKRAIMFTHGELVPDTERGREHLLVLLRHVMLFKNGWPTAVRHLRLFAPWMPEHEGLELIEQARKTAVYLDDEEIARLFAVTLELRQRYRLRTFGAIDAPSPEARRKLAKDRRNENRRAARRAAPKPPRKTEGAPTQSVLSQRAKDVFAIIRPDQTRWLCDVEKELAAGPWRDMKPSTRHSYVARAVKEMTAKGFAKSYKSPYGRHDIEVRRATDDEIIAVHGANRCNEKSLQGDGHDRGTGEGCNEGADNRSRSDGYNRCTDDGHHRENDRCKPAVTTEDPPYKNLTAEWVVLGPQFYSVELLFGGFGTVPGGAPEGAPADPVETETGSTSAFTYSVPLGAERVPADDVLVAVPEPNPASILDVLARGPTAAPQPIELVLTTGEIRIDTGPGPQPRGKPDAKAEPPPDEKPAKKRTNMDVAMEVIRERAARGL